MKLLMIKGEFVMTKETEILFRHLENKIETAESSKEKKVLRDLRGEFYKIIREEAVNNFNALQHNN